MAKLPSLFCIVAQLAQTPNMVDKSMAHNDCGLSSHLKMLRIGHFLLPQSRSPVASYGHSLLYIVLTDRCTLSFRLVVTNKIKVLLQPRYTSAQEAFRFGSWNTVQKHLSLKRFKGYFYKLGRNVCTVLYNNHVQTYFC